MGSERRRALRVPVHGVAVFYGEDGAMHGRIENLSKSGALVSVAGVPTADGDFDVELKLGVDSGWASARTVRVDHPHRKARRWTIAIEFEQLEAPIRAAIESAVEAALRAAQRRPILVLDDDHRRRVALLRRLAARGATPLAPSTPLEAVDLLARSDQHVAVCLIAPRFGHSAAELSTLVHDSFPWVTTADITDDLDSTVDRAMDAWSGTEVARLTAALA
ncbi:MAG TPA: PilZ domain-containing protein [Kofleriaceae bacterium]